MTETADPAPSAPSTIPEILLALQAVDTTADQLGHRREHSPLHDDLASASTAMRSWEQRRTALRSRIDELGTSIDDAERRGTAGHEGQRRAHVLRLRDPSFHLRPETKAFQRGAAILTGGHGIDQRHGEAA